MRFQRAPIDIDENMEDVKKIGGINTQLEFFLKKIKFKAIKNFTNVFINVPVLEFGLILSPQSYIIPKEVNFDHWKR